MGSETTARMGRMAAGVALGIVLGLAVSYYTGNPSMVSLGIGGGLAFAIALDASMRDE